MGIGEEKFYLRHCWDTTTLKAIALKISPLDRFFSNFANILPIIRESKIRNKKGGGGARPRLRAIANQTYPP